MYEINDILLKTLQGEDYMNNIFGKICNLQRRNNMLPVNYYVMFNNGYVNASLIGSIYDENSISISAALDRCCVKQSV